MDVAATPFAVQAILDLRNFSVAKNYKNQKIITIQEFPHYFVLKFKLKSLANITNTKKSPLK